MKNLFYLFLVLTIAGFTASCTVQKRHYMKGYHVSRPGKNTEPAKKVTASRSVIKAQLPEEVVVGPERAGQALSASAGDRVPDLSKKRRQVIFSVLPPDSCDNIIMRSGEEVSANVIEIGVDVIKYRKCDHPDGPVYSARKADIFMVRYKNGRKEVIESTGPTQQAAAKVTPQKKRLLPAALISFLSAMVSLFIAGLLFGAIAVVLAIVALVKINRYPDEYKGTGFAVAGLVIGLLAVFVSFIILSMI